MKRTGKSRILRNGMKCVAAYALAFGVGLSMPMSVMAESYDISIGSIRVEARNDGNRYVTQTNNSNAQDHRETTETIISGGTTDHNVTIDSSSEQTASVTFRGLDIISTNAAVSTSGEGNVSIELGGSNTLLSGIRHAGLEKDNSGTLSIDDKNENGSLEAVGRDGGAGIGGGLDGTAGNVVISGDANVTATGTGDHPGAAIGSGHGRTNDQPGEEMTEGDGLDTSYLYKTGSITRGSAQTVSGQKKR